MDDLNLSVNEAKICSLFKSLTLHMYPRLKILCSPQVFSLENMSISMYIDILYIYIEMYIIAFFTKFHYSILSTSLDCVEQLNA